MSTPQARKLGWSAGRYERRKSLRSEKQRRLLRFGTERRYSGRVDILESWFHKFHSWNFSVGLWCPIDRYISGSIHCECGRRCRHPARICRPRKLRITMPGDFGTPSILGCSGSVLFSMVQYGSVWFSGWYFHWMKGVAFCRSCFTKQESQERRLALSEGMNWRTATAVWETRLKAEA